MIIIGQTIFANVHGSKKTAKLPRNIATLHCDHFCFYSRVYPFKLGW